MWCAGPGAPLGARPLVAAYFGTRGCRGPAHQRVNHDPAAIVPRQQLVCHLFWSRSGSARRPVALDGNDLSGSATATHMRDQHLSFAELTTFQEVR